MAAQARGLLSVEEYLHTSYEVDCQYVDDRLEARHAGQGEHSAALTNIELLERFAAIDR